MSTTWVAIGANEVRDYQFLAPLSALVWRDVIGFQPIVLRCDEWLTKKRGVAASDALAYHGIAQVILNPLQNYLSHTLAQNCRELASCLELPEGDWMMPTDADLWPVRKAFYQQHQGGPMITCYYGNGDHYQTIPTCHVTAQVGTWRKMYGVKQGDNITYEVQKLLDGWMPNYRQKWPWTDRNFAVWMSDQAIVAEKVKDVMAREPGQVKMIERRGHPPIDRLDRGVWPTGEYDLSDYVDSHLLRPADQPEHWPRIKVLIEKLIPQHLDWACKYREDYLAGY